MPLPSGSNCNTPSIVESEHSASSNEVDTSPFCFRNNRRYLREVPKYPLPVDLPELHRQSLRTILYTELFGKPYCARFKRPPERILELVCGSATWSLRCDRYLKKIGHPPAAFTGLDIAPLAPDLTRYGVNWRFVQHDLRKPPIPFPTNYWDLIVINDSAMVLSTGRDIWSNPMASLKRYLRPGGCIEVLENDYVFRCLQPEPAAAHGTATEDTEQAKRTATYTVGPATPFSKAQNPYLADYNRWAEKSLQERGITATPCAAMNFGLATESSEYEDFGSRRVAIPFSQIRWEDDVENRVESKTPSIQRDKSSSQRLSSSAGDFEKMSGSRIGKGKGLTKCSAHQMKEFKPLTQEQAALRRTALSVTVGLIESLEPILMEQSGMKRDEWSRWWGNMMVDLMERNGTYNGECLEVGVWWARKGSSERASGTSSLKNTEAHTRSHRDDFEHQNGQHGARTGSTKDLPIMTKSHSQVGDSSDRRLGTKDAEPKFNDCNEDDDDDEDDDDTTDDSDTDEGNESSGHSRSGSEVL